MHQYDATLASSVMDKSSQHVCIPITALRSCPRQPRLDALMRRSSSDGDEHRPFATQLERLQWSSRRVPETRDQHGVARVEELEEGR